MHQSKKSSGEVAAIMGYEFQYSIFATEIYNALLNDKNQIEWIEFASNNAGKIDDVLIGLENSILAFQVKDIGSSSFSYKTFTYSDTQSILEGMFSGWQKIKSTYPKKKIDVRFITTQSVSENDKIEAYSDKKKPSFKEFLNKLWNPIAENRYEADNLPLKWQAVFQEMVSKVNCSKLEFVQFVKNTTFVFDYSLPKQFDSYIERQRRIDIEDITKNIFQTVSKKGSIRFDKKSFLEHFGLLGRYETYYTHSFFVDEEHYQPINETIAQLDKLITDYPKGYISLVGNAGSGKSTLLTKWLQRSNYVILKYYAYTNTDMSYEFGFRGEAKTFLHDILIQIRQAKHSIQERLPTDDFTDLQKHFNEELNKLSKENTKVIIVVDGLDHIEREQDVATSLLGVLPLPDNIPENIYFILGTRTIENLEKLHTRIKNTIKEDGRVIIIKPLSKTQIQSFLSTYQIVLSADLLEMLFVNTKGHPLFLRYTIEEIRSKGGEHLEELISQRVFSGDIYNEYKVFWERYKKQDDFIQILGIISRFRHSFFNIEILSMFPRISRENQYNVNKLSENYFYKIGTTWQFFHNSFKEFLITETSRNIFTGSFDKTSDIGFHLRIVEAINGIESDYKWNNIYHLYKAEEFGRITELANQDYFRKQWFDFRNRNLIKEDIQFSINSANKLKDVYCLFRCLLSIFELKQRYTNFDPSHYFTTFHQLGKIALANSFVYDNIELLVSPKNALSYSVILYEQGYKELSYDIYLRAIPSYILNQSKIVSPRRYERNTYQEVNEIELVLAWVRAACLFTPLDDIFSKIRELTVGEENQPDRERDLFAEASSEILGISVRVKNWANLKALEKILQTSNKRYNLFYFYFDIVNKLTGEDDFYGYCLQVLQSWEITEDNPINRRLLIVNLLITKNSEKTNLIFSKLLPPNRVEKPDYSINEHDYLYYIFDYSRFFYITKKDFTISSISFLPTGNKHTKTAFYYALAELGKSYAYVYHDYKDAAIGYCLNLENALKLFHYSHADSAFEYSVSENKPLLVKLILEISSKASLDVFNRILEILGTEWEVNKRYWDTKHIHEVIEWVYTSGLNNKWCVSQLEKIDTYIFEEGYLDDRITNGIGQIRLWSKAGLINKGEAIFNHIMNISLDVRGEKDYQLDYIVEWIELLSADMSKEISFYLKRVRLLREKVNSPSHTPSRELLRMALKYGNGFEISKYLLFEGLVDFCDNMEEVLTYLSTSLPQYKRLLVKLYIRIILAYDNSQHTRYNFFKNLFERLPQISTDELRELVRQVSIYSISEYKNNYLLKVQEYAAKKNIDLSSIGLNDKIVIKEEYTQTKTDELKLEDGTILSLSDLLERVTTVEQLNEIKQKAIPQSDFNWINLYSKISNLFSDNEINEFLINDRYGAREVGTIVEGLIENNRIDFAKSILYKTIHNGEKYGWVTFYDGGSKIVPFGLLSKIENKDIFQKEVMNDFSNSIASLDIQAIEILIKEVPKIWKYFSDNIEIEKLYNEIVDFRNELLKTYPEDNYAPSIKGNMDDEDLLLETVFFILTLPSDFNYSLYEILLEEYVISTSITKRLLQRLYVEGYFSKYIKLIAILNTKYKNVAIEHKENIIILLNSKRYDISRISSRLLLDIGITPADYIVNETKEVPLVYRMEIEYKPSFFNTKDSDLDHINKKGFLKDTEDPLVYVRLYYTQIRMLSEETGIDIINLAHRVLYLGKDLEFPSWCSSISEEEIRNIYSRRFDLEVSYKRPRNQLVWDGLMKVVKELYELDLIEKSLADEISNEFDEKAYLVNTNPRPNFVSSIIERKSGSAPSASKGWAENLTDEYLRNTLKLQTQDNSTVLAEYSVVKGMGWGYAEELRQSFVSLNSTITSSSDREIVFDMTTDNFIEDYLELDDKGIVLYNGLLTMNKKRNWLAINPLLSKDLNLVYNENEDCFRWDDKEGNKIIESIYWQTHSTDNHSKNHQSETGYGWCVILYEKGYEMFRRIIGDKKLYQHKKISRLMEYNSSRHKEELKESFSNYISEQIKL